MADGLRQFRIMDGPSIPWAMIAPHEQQAQENHGQSLVRLNARGGLSSLEAVGVLTGTPWRDVRGMPETEAKRRLRELVDAWLASPGGENARLADRIASLESQLAEANAMLAECKRYVELRAAFSIGDDMRVSRALLAKLRGRERADG